MTKDDKKDQEKGEEKTSEGKASAPDDFEKTVLDVNVRDLEKSLDETMIFKRPQMEEEDTDLHRLKKLAELERSRAASLSKESPQEPSAETPRGPPEGSPEVPDVSQQRKEVPPQEILAPSEAKKETSTEKAEPSAPSGIGKAGKILEFVGGLLFLLLLLDASIEGLSAGSPLSKFTIGATLLCILVSVFFILKRGNFHIGVETTVCAFLALLAYSTWKYGSADPEAFTVLKHPPAELFNFIFLAVYLLALFGILFPFKKFTPVKIVFSLLILYGSLGILENLFRGKVWNLEDTLLGSSFWSWMPLYQLRPPVFGFWVLIPVLLIYFLFFRALRKKVGQGVGLPGGFVALLLLLSLGLAHVLLLNRNLSSFIGFFVKSSLGMGQTRAVAFGEEGIRDDDVEVVTSNVQTEKQNDAIPLYQMAAVFGSSSDGKKNISLTVRGQGGRPVPFLNTNDLEVLQERVPQKPLRIRFREEPLLKPASLAVLIDRSSPMASALPWVDGAVRNLLGITNSKESVLLVSFADDVKLSWIRRPEEAKKWLSGLFSQGGRNLGEALNKTLVELHKGSGTQTIFLITTSDASLAQEFEVKFAGQLKASKTKLYAFVFGDARAALTLKGLAEDSGGRLIGLPNPQYLASALRAGFADVFGEYQISYEGQSFAPKLQVASPASGSEIFKETPLQLNILNAKDIRLKGARLYLDGKLLQEIPAQGAPSVQFILTPGQLPRGLHAFKAAVLTEDGKEFSEEIKLNIGVEQEFHFVRPLEGDVVGGQVNLEAFFKSHSQNTPTRVDFLVDGQKVGEAVSEPYLFTWDATSQTGTHVLQATANFADGSMKTDQVKVNVQPGFSVKFISPSVGEFLSSAEILEADVNHGPSDVVTKVEFYCDGQLLGEVPQPPYKYSWDNSDLPAGSHVIQARAYSASNMTSTDAVSANIGTGSLSVTMSEGGASAGGPSFFSPDYMEWIIDASNSMNGQLGGLQKSDFVKQALIDLLPMIPSTTQVAYRFFGSESRASHHDCKDSILAYPMKPVDSNKIAAVLNSVEPKGLTPLAMSLEKVRNDLKTAAGSRVVVLFTDGYENCGGDPVRQLEQWKKEKLNAKLHIIGLDLDGTRAETDLKKLASLTGGQYFSVHDSKEIFSALEEVVKVTYRVTDYKGRDVVQKQVGSPPVPLRAGEYKVEVDLEPILAKDKVLINHGVEKKLFLKKDGNAFSLQEL
jgi:Big-like domain-containing protein/von Willebrand factor type A domain-containing protein/VWA domain-containing protein